MYFHLTSLNFQGKTSHNRTLVGPLTYCSQFDSFGRFQVLLHKFNVFTAIFLYNLRFPQYCKKGEIPRVYK